MDEMGLLVHEVALDLAYVCVFVRGCGFVRGCVFVRWCVFVHGHVFVRGRAFVPGRVFVSASVHDVSVPACECVCVCVFGTCVPCLPLAERHTVCESAGGSDSEDTAV